MCSAANYVLPLRRTCKVLASPVRLCGGGSTVTSFPKARFHGASQDTDMDLAWQELMAISELQEFAVPCDVPYETIQHHPMDLMGGYSMAQTHSETYPIACDLNSAAAFEGSFSEARHTGQPMNANTDAMYGPSGSQTSPKMLSVSLQPSTIGIMEQIDIVGTGEMDIMTNSCLSHGSSRHLPGTLRGQLLHTRLKDDLESDSGLSLGSTPPLASPDNGLASMPGYQATEVGLNFSDAEVDITNEQIRRTQMEYPVDTQNQRHSFLYSGPHTYFPNQPDLSLAQPHAVQFANQTGLSNTFNNLHINCRVANRGGSNQDLCIKQYGNMTAPPPLSRDERRALALKIPFSIDRIINLPVDDFNELLTQYTLTDTQLALIRDIRRRGKNKVAAQNCRKRKMENIIHLEGELGQLQVQRDHLARERVEFQRSLAAIKCRLTELYNDVFSRLRDEQGNPYSINEYHLEQTPDGKIYLVPHSTRQGR